MMLIVHSVMTPVICAATVEHLSWAAIISFVARSPRRQTRWLHFACPKMGMSMMQIQMQEHVHIGDACGRVSHCECFAKLVRSVEGVKRKQVGSSQLDPYLPIEGWCQTSPLSFLHMACASWVAANLRKEPAKARKELPHFEGVSFFWEPPFGLKGKPKGSQPC